MSRRVVETRRVTGLVAAAILVVAAAACSGGGLEAGTTVTTASPTTLPLALTEQQAFELQAQAMARAWHSPRLCINEESAPAELRAALAPLYEEILYVGISSAHAPTVGWDACTLVSVMPVRRLGPGVVGVDVWILQGFLDGIGETYLFRWDGTAWVDATPEETGVTVTSAVS